MTAILILLFYQKILTTVPTIQSWCVRWIIILHCLNCFQVGWNSVVSIVTRHGLDGWGIEFQWGVRFSTPIQTGPGNHPAIYTGTRSLLWGKTAGLWR